MRPHYHVRCVDRTGRVLVDDEELADTPRVARARAVLITARWRARGYRVRCLREGQQWIATRDAAPAEWVLVCVERCCDPQCCASDPLFWLDEPLPSRHWHVRIDVASGHYWRSPVWSAPERATEWAWYLVQRWRAAGWRAVGERCAQEWYVWSSREPTRRRWVRVVECASAQCAGALAKGGQDGEGCARDARAHGAGAHRG